MKSTSTPSGSRCSVGSSRMRIDGSSASARAISTTKRSSGPQVAHVRARVDVGGGAPGGEPRGRPGVLLARASGAGAVACRAACSRRPSGPAAARAPGRRSPARARATTAATALRDASPSISTVPLSATIGPGRDADERRLAGAVLADDRVHLAAPHREAHVLERVDAGIALVDALEPERDFRQAVRRGRGRSVRPDCFGIRHAS